MWIDCRDNLPGGGGAGAGIPPAAACPGVLDRCSTNCASSHIWCLGGRDGFLDAEDLAPVFHLLHPREHDYARIQVRPHVISPPADGRWRGCAANGVVKPHVAHCGSRHDCCSAWAPSVPGSTCHLHKPSSHNACLDSRLPHERHAYRTCLCILEDDAVQVGTVGLVFLASAGAADQLEAADKSDGWQADSSVETHISEGIVLQFLPLCCLWRRYTSWRRRTTLPTFQRICRNVVDHMSYRQCRRCSN